MANDASSNQIAIDNTINSIANDSYNPQATFTLDGFTVDSTGFRKQQIENAMKLMRLQNGLQPYLIRTLHRMS